MLKNFLNNMHYYPYINPLITDEINRMGEYYGLNKYNTRDSKIIVSLSSVRERYHKLPPVLYSLLNQTLKPDMVILWLDDETEDLTTIPYEITQFKKNGLEIRFTKKVNKYTNIICTLKEFRESIIVAVSDSIIYPKDWLRRLYLSYVSMPNSIHVHSAKKVLLDNKDNFISYGDWKYINKESADFSNFINSEEGALFPPNCFTNEVFREDIYLKNAPVSVDTWFWIMALTHNRKICVVKNHYRMFACIDYFERIKNCFINSGSNAYDNALNSLIKYYRQNILNKLSVR